MANSKITFTFSGDPSSVEFITFNRYKLAFPGTSSIQIETFSEFGRFANFKVPTTTTVNPPYPIAGSSSAFEYQKYFNIDYNGFGIYNITWNGSNEVEIELTSLDWGINTVSVPSTVTYVIENYVEPVGFISITDSSRSSASSDFCSKFKAGMTTNVLATTVKLNGITLTTTNTANPFTYDVLRGINNVFEVESAEGFTNTGTFLPVNFLSADNINVTVTTSLIGATVSVDVTDSSGLSLEYSLDNVNWQDSNVFTGQIAGTKFLYVRDQFSCVKSKEYTITSLGTRSPIVIISRANSINFSKEEVWDGCSIFENDENTLSCKSLSKFNHITDILFQTCDDTTTQLKSNYETVSAVLKDSSGIGTALTVVKKSTNLNRFQSLDGTYYKFREGKLGIYFDDGNTYDEFGAIIGEYTLDGNLPEFAIIGQFISIHNVGTFEIKDILYDETKNKRVIIVDYTYEGVETIAKVESVYDILPYEIYEFDIDWSSFSVGKYSVTITNTDTVNGTVIHNSERINLATTHIDTLAIDYSNNNNKDIFYKYGIKHFIRVPFTRFIAKQSDESEINITDNNAIVVESTVNELNEIKFDVLSNAVMRKLVVALSCENLFINGTGYVKDGSVDTENIENTNLHEVTATLIKTNVSYTNFKQGISGVETEVGEFDTPQIITTGTNFIKA